MTYYNLFSIFVDFKLELIFISIIWKIPFSRRRWSFSALKILLKLMNMNSIQPKWDNFWPMLWVVFSKLDFKQEFCKFIKIIKEYFTGKNAGSSSSLSKMLPLITRGLVEWKAETRNGSSTGDERTSDKSCKMKFFLNYYTGVQFRKSSRPF